MNQLAERLRQAILAEGPIGVDRFMGEANAHYYATRDPLGVDGDFTTAPEISQMFGELVGAALADVWLRAGGPEEAMFVELGPGRGTLAHDALRVMRSGGFAGEVHLVETSPVLRQLQSERIPDARWHETIDDLPPRPMMLIANEFLDALPIKQFIAGEERKVVRGAERFVFKAEGEIVEHSPARDALVRRLAAHLIAHGGAAILIDYGYRRAGPGDTLQAMRNHHFSPPLDHPGEQDLTAHVNFEAVARAATGAEVTPVASQGTWLERLGIGARAMALAARSPGRTKEIAAARRRLCDEAEMGELFKVIALHAPGWPEPAGFRA